MEDDKNIKASLLPAQYKMRFYEKEFPEPDELVMVLASLIQGISQKLIRKRMLCVSSWVRYEGRHDPTQRVFKNHDQSHS